MLHDAVYATCSTRAPALGCAAWARRLGERATAKCLRLASLVLQRSASVSRPSCYSEVPPSRVPRATAKCLRLASLVLQRSASASRPSCYSEVPPSRVPRATAKCLRLASLVLQRSASVSRPSCYSEVPPSRVPRATARSACLHRQSLADRCSSGGACPPCDPSVGCHQLRNAASQHHNLPRYPA
jgi:hypothetical protein